MDHNDGEGTQERRRLFNILVEVALRGDEGDEYKFDEEDVHAFETAGARATFIQGHSEMQEWGPAQNPQPEVGPSYSGRGGRRCSDEAHANALALAIAAGVERQGDDEVNCWDMTPAHMVWIQRIIAHEGVRHGTVAELPADASNFLEAVSLIEPPKNQRFPNFIAMCEEVRLELALKMPHGRPSNLNSETWQDAMDRAQTDEEKKQVEQAATRAFNKKIIGMGYHVRKGTSVVDHRKRGNPNGEIQYIITCNGWNTGARAGSNNGGNRRKL